MVLHDVETLVSDLEKMELEVSTKNVIYLR